MVAVVSRSGPRFSGTRECCLARCREAGVDDTPAEPCARLSFRLRLGRQHLVPLRANQAANAPSPRDVSAQDHVRTSLSASRLRIRTAKPSIPASRRSVGLRLRPDARAQRIPPDAPGTGFMALD